MHRTLIAGMILLLGCGADEDIPTQQTDGGEKEVILFSGFSGGKDSLTFWIDPMFCSDVILTGQTDYVSGGTFDSLEIRFAFSSTMNDTILACDGTPGLDRVRLSGFFLYHLAGVAGGFQLAFPIADTTAHSGNYSFVFPSGSTLDSLRAGVRVNLAANQYVGGRDISVTQFQLIGRRN